MEDATKNLLQEHRQALLDLARSTIAHGVAHGRPAPVHTLTYPVELRSPAATFVTLNSEGQLRGCVGTLYPVRPLVEDVAHNAYAAAFHDPRFEPVTQEELDRISPSISLLSPPMRMEVETEAELTAALRPGEDGLILEEGRYRSTFLPAVWESLPEPPEFLAHLKRKAGLPANYWSPTMKFYRYKATSIKPG